MHAIRKSIAIEARAKILWGESPQKVRDYLMSQNVGEKDATTLLDEIVAERSAAMRSKGWRKIFLGTSYSLTPVVYYYVTHAWIGYWDLKIFAALIVLSAVGLAKLTSGVFMTLRPSAVRED